MFEDAPRVTYLKVRVPQFRYSVCPGNEFGLNEFGTISQCGDMKIIVEMLVTHN